MKTHPCLLLILALIIPHTSQAQNEPVQSDTPTNFEIPMDPFGELSNGQQATVYTLTNQNGLKARISDFGATLVSLEAPDRDGNISDVTLGFESVDGYDSDANPYLGATVGRFGNRIADGQFSLDGQIYQLATNNEPGGIPCHLHGGDRGFNRRMWTVKNTSEPGSITLEYVSAAGEEGYPGKLTVEVTYELTDENELRWIATATTDAPTIINLVHHSYWNLSGDPTTSVNDHVLTLYADHFLTTDAGLIPTGDRVSVKDTPMDFTEATAIGKRVEADFEPLELAGGYDHAWVLNGTEGNEGLTKAARLQDPATGRVMEVATNQPAIQFYGGNFLDGSVTGRGGIAYEKRSACALETENFPDAPNQEDFPCAVLRPGETYKHIMVHRFSTQ